MTTSFAFSHLYGRRVIHAGLALLIAVIGITSSFTSAQAEDRAVKYMRRAAAALINAQKKGSAAGFARVVKQYGHVPAIGMYALGSYSRGLVHSDRRSYYHGLAKFIGRYAAKESPKYPVARVKFAPSAIRDGRSVMVDSQVIMRDGTAYDVRWLLVPNRKSFRVRDAQVLSSIWVSPFLKNLFESYIAENGGRVKNLVIALNR
jgi:phospholipid transport system substrate-binding protein